MKAPLPPSETQRLGVLREYGILDTPPEAAFDDLTQLASRICDTPIALLTLVDGERQWFKSRIGTELPETSRDISFCAHAILESDVFVIPDATLDRRFADNPTVTGALGLRFYAGAQLVTENGDALGTLCVMDRVPRQLEEAQLDSLRALARQAMAQLELRRYNRRLEALLEERHHAEQMLEQRAQTALRQQSVLVHLARHDKSDLCTSLQEITRLDAAALDVERVSIWFFDRSYSKIVCEDMFESGAGEHSQGARLEASHYPNYFAALREQRVIAAADARNDPRTSEFTDDYLVPLGITSMLDVPIWRDGEVVGIVCHEHTGELREWLPAEQHFAASMADMVSLCLEAHDRRRTSAELQAAHLELEQRVAERTAELARANEALKRSEEHFRLLIENSSDIATVVDATATILYTSPSIERVLRYRQQDVIGTHALDLVHPDDVAPTRAALERLLEHPGEELSVEYRLRSGDNEWRVMEAIARTLLPDSAAAGVVINSRDITERKQADEQLRLQKTLLEAQGEASVDGILVISQDGSILSYNRRFVEIWGLSAEVVESRSDELALQAVLDKIVDPQAFLERVAHLYAHPEETSQDEIELKDGRVLDRRSGPVTSEDGHYYGRIWFFRDVTERHEAEKKLRRREEYFRSLIENGADIIGIIDAAGRIRYDSPSVERLLGYRPAELVGRSVFDYLHPEDVGRTREMLENVLVAPGAGMAVEFYFRHSDGSYRLLEAAGKPLVVEGQLEGVVVNARDITQRKRQEEALQRAIHEAQEAREVADRANRAKSEFLSRMSHELRTPLNSILGFAQLMAKKELAPDQRKGMDHILKAGRHLLNLINEVLDIARIESNRQQFSIEPVRVRSVLLETLSLIRPLAAQHGVRIDNTLAMDGDPYASADRQRFTQVMLNLLSNAVKYNRPGGLVRISCVPQESNGDPAVRIRVHDTGYGISPDKLDRLFTPFERLGAEQSEVEGTGLGLALSRRLVEAMGGALHVETRQGSGSTFTVELPLVESPVERLTQNGGFGSGRMNDAAGRAATVLYIEDNLANLSLIETILAGRPEITLMSALQGQLGIELAWQHAPDLILLDLHLPDMSGDDVLRRLRGDERTRETPVMVISADATSGRTQRLMDAGADAYMTKPLDVDDFLETVDRLLLEREGPTRS